MVTFIIPTISRPSLLNSLKSLQDQLNPHPWQALVILDWVAPDFELPEDDRITYLWTPKKLGSEHQHGQAGLVRNYGMKKATSKWLAFLDDDDTITCDYLNHFYYHLATQPDLDLLIFRMTMQGAIYPPMGWGIEECKVGISFAIRREYIVEKDIWFPNGDTEDYKFLASMRDSGCKYFIAPEVAYIAN